MKFKFEVYDKDGNNITNKENWVIDTSGNLYYEIEDIDCPLNDVEFSVYEGCKYKIIFE